MYMPSLSKESTRRASSRHCAIAALTISVLGVGTGDAAEGGFSFFLPGAAGDIALALEPEPGVLVANTLFVQSGAANAAVLQGRVNLGLDLDLALNIVAATYTFDERLLGARATVGAAIPFGYASLEGTLAGPCGGVRQAQRDAFNLGDIALIPLQLNWNSGDFSFKLAEVIYAPTGAYDVNNAVNIGLNRWGFDTVAAVTYFNQQTGTEVSVSPGVIINTENPDTDYRTGTEFHLDFTANQFLSETFALGVRGYYYHQLSGDRGAGARLGDFKGEAFGAGPGFLWIPGFAEGRLTVLGKWIHDFSAKNRFKSEYGTLTVAWTF